MESSYSRVRSVKLRRPSEDSPFGFSVRGGHEHGTGIFVSWVDPRSQPFKNGLRVGDQILRVNGFPVSTAVHHEVLALMRLGPHLHLKVRSVGMLPVKERRGEPLTWKLVEEQPQLVGGGAEEEYLSGCGSSPADSPPTEAKIFIDMTGRSGLGCCICKGPVERPGIYVQSTKVNGVAREAGLRPGDQILASNGHSFLHVPFAEAVQHLKGTSQLRLRVLKGAASDLFPGESSSGYNSSSASSLNGDHGGGGGEQRHRLLPSHHEPRQGGSGSGSSGPITHLDEGMEWDEVERVWRSAERETIVIEVKGGGSYEPGEESDPRLLLAEERRKLEATQARLLEEALKLEEEKRKWEEEKRRCPIPNSRGEAGPSSSGGGGGGNSCLAGALHQEILKRSERRESGVGGGGEGEESLEGEEALPPPGTVEAKKSLFNSQIDLEKRQQHEQLIEEFKRAHRKMFAASTLDSVAEGQGGTGDNAADAAAAELIRARRVQKELDHERQMVAQRVAGIVRQRQLRIERQHQESEETEREIRQKSPPPPPPMPLRGAATTKGPAPPPPHHQQVTQPPKRVLILEEGKSHGGNLKKVGGGGGRGVAPAPPIPTSSNRNNSSSSNKGKAPPTPTRGGVQGSGVPGGGGGGGGEGVVGGVSTRPASPSPDYSNSPSPIPQKRGGGGRMGAVEMQSLESYHLKDPPRSAKKPPPVYFSPSGQGGSGGVANNNSNANNGGQRQASGGSGFVEDKNQRNRAHEVVGGAGILKGTKSISFLDKY